MNSLQYRKDRMTNLANEWQMEKVRDLFVRKKISDKLYRQLRQSIGIYIARALDFEYTQDENELIKRINECRNNRTNITPNGAVVPKREFALEYNIYIRNWCAVVKELVENNPKMLNKYRLTPNVRIKFEEELKDNIGRSLSTSYAHSDAWLEGPWGMNCHMPIFGDTDNNYLHFYKLKDESKFEDRFLETSAEYANMQWVLDYYEDDNVIPQKGYVNISDYALIHQTRRKNNGGTRVSIDTTIFVGDHDVHPDRKIEYMDEIPNIGEDFFVACNVSEKGPVHEKRSTFSHYTSGTLSHIKI